MHKNYRTTFDRRTCLISLDTLDTILPTYRRARFLQLARYELKVLYQVLQTYPSPSYHLSSIHSRSLPSLVSLYHLLGYCCPDLNAENTRPLVLSMCPFHDEQRRLGEEGGEYGF